MLLQKMMLFIEKQDILSKEKITTGVKIVILQKNIQTKTDEKKALEDRLSAEKVKYEASLTNHDLKVEQHLIKDVGEEHQPK